MRRAQAHSDLEDDADLRRMFRHALVFSGYSVEEASDGHCPRLPALQLAVTMTALGAAAWLLASDDPGFLGLTLRASALLGLSAACVYTLRRIDSRRSRL